jgi:hypothetical protein
MRALVHATALAALAASGCSPKLRTFGAESPVLRPPEAQSSPEEAFGRQARVYTKTEVFYGELVACDDAYLYLFVNDQLHPWTMVPWPAITHAEARGPSGGGGPALIAWTVVGSLSTISHGWWAVLTAGAWIGVGVPSVFWAQSQESVNGRCNDLQPYTRYPQGLPPAIRARYWGGGPVSMPPGMPPVLPPPLPAPSAPPPAPPAPSSPPPAPPASSSPPVIAPPGAPSAPPNALPPRAPAPPSGMPDPLPVMPPIPPSAPVPAPGVPPR